MFFLLLSLLYAFDLKNVFMCYLILFALLHIYLKITLPVSPLPDKKIWKHAPDGVLTSKLAHLFMSPPLARLD